MAFDMRSRTEYIGLQVVRVSQTEEFVVDGWAENQEIFRIVMHGDLDAGSTRRSLSFLNHCGRRCGVV